jgi:hypothetical protein
MCFSTGLHLQPLLVAGYFWFPQFVQKYWRSRVSTVNTRHVLAAQRGEIVRPADWVCDWWLDDTVSVRRSSSFCDGWFLQTGENWVYQHRHDLYVVAWELMWTDCREVLSRWVLVTYADILILALDQLNAQILVL